jgi:tRNA threonylcarbamoyladenosine dehydratase
MQTCNGWCAEALCRGGVGTLVLIDGDVVDSTNRNRQLPALHSTIGSSKVDVCFIPLPQVCRCVHVFATVSQTSFVFHPYPCIVMVAITSVQVMARRLKDINPDIRIVARQQFLDPQAARELANQPCDFIVDCIDSITPKVGIVLESPRQLSC